MLTPADEEFHVDKRVFKTPFVCGCRNLGEALRRVHEGAAMIRTKGEPGTGNVVEAVRHMRSVVTEIQALQGQDEKVLAKKAVEYRVPFELVAWVSEAQRMPVPNFSAVGKMLSNSLENASISRRAAGVASRKFLINIE